MRQLVESRSALGNSFRESNLERTTFQDNIIKGISSKLHWSQISQRRMNSVITEPIHIICQFQLKNLLIWKPAKGIEGARVHLKREINKDAPVPMYHIGQLCSDRNYFVPLVLYQNRILEVYTPGKGTETLPTKIRGA